VDHNPAQLIADLRGLGIGLRESGNQIQADRDLPPEFLPLLRRHYQEIAHELWKEQGAARQAIALARLKADKDGWIEESKRLGKYIGPQPPTA
jgi:hypothetical protein